MTEFFKKINSAMNQEAVVLVFLFLISWAVNRYTILPGGLFGMALFLALLQMNVLKETSFKTITPFLLVNIAFFFIPPAAKVVDELDALDGAVVKLFLMLVISNAVVLGVTGVVVQWVLRRETRLA